VTPRTAYSGEAYDKPEQGTRIYEMDQLVKDAPLHVNDAREAKEDSKMPEISWL
jgi:hypothetical protein